jgi:hypothetical protein
VKAGWWPAPEFQTDNLNGSNRSIAVIDGSLALANPRQSNWHLMNCIPTTRRPSPSLKVGSGVLGRRRHSQLPQNLHASRGVDAVTAANKNIRLRA